MHPTDIMAHPAGPALDALLHQHVRGRPVVHAAVAWSESDWHGSDMPTARNDLGEPNERFPDYGPAHWVIPAYSTDLAAAWALVDHLIAAGACPVDLRYLAQGLAPSGNAGLPNARSLGYHWVAAFGFTRPVAAADPALALCRAALLHHFHPFL